MADLRHWTTIDAGRFTFTEAARPSPPIVIRCVDDDGTVTRTTVVYLNGPGLEYEGVPPDVKRPDELLYQTGRGGVVSRGAHHDPIQWRVVSQGRQRLDDVGGDHEPVRMRPFSSLPLAAVDLEDRPRDERRQQSGNTSEIGSL